MAAIEIGDLDAQLLERLRSRAASHGVSLEVEVKGILARAVDPDTGRLASLRAHWARLPADPGPVELDSARIIRADRDGWG